MLIQCWCCAVACELMVQHVRTKLASRGVAFKDEGTHLLRTLVESPAAGNQFVCLLPPISIDSSLWVLPAAASGGYNVSNLPKEITVLEATPGLR